jgi:hypothetical protein
LKISLLRPFLSAVIGILLFATAAAADSSVAAAAAAVPPPPRHGSISESQFFTIASYDARSSFHVARFAQHLDALVERDFRITDTLRPRIRIELVPREEAPRDAPYLLRVHPENISVSLRWDRETTREITLRALTHALLARLCQINNARSPANVPPWLITAYVMEVEASLNPALLDCWTERAENTPPLPLAVILNPKKQFTDTASAEQAFWFWRHLRRDLRAKKIDTRTFLAELASEPAAEHLLPRLFPKTWADRDLRALWWPTGYVQLTHENFRLAHTPQESRQYLSDASSFVFAPNGTDLRFSPREIIPLRHLPAVRDEVRERLRRLKYDIPRANPIWHNAWRAYGVFLEKFPTASETELTNLCEQTTAETNISLALESKIARLLKNTDEDARRPPTANNP